jgi:sarcosine oxidase subunit beta
LAFYDEITGLYTHPCGELQLVGLDWHFDVVWGPDDYQRQPDQDYLEAAHQALCHRFPSLAAARPIKAAVGLYDFTPDGHPIVDGPLGIDGYYVMAGFSGAGFKSSPALGLALAEKMLYGEERTLSLHFLRRSRF